MADDSPPVPALRTLVERTIGVESELCRRLKLVPGIDAAAIYGSWARAAVKPTSDIDLLVIGSPDADDLERAVRAVEGRSGREVNLSLYGPRIGRSGCVVARDLPKPFSSAP